MNAAWMPRAALLPTVGIEICRAPVLFMKNHNQMIAAPKKLKNAGGLRVCITGGIACGKSVLGALLAQKGFAVIEADNVCHKLMRAGTVCCKAIVRRFGRSVVGRNGEIDRAALARRVFANVAERKALEAILHPRARRAIKVWLAKNSRISGCRAVAGIAIVPLLYEAGWEQDWDLVICVAAPEQLQAQRLRARGLGAAEIHRRIAAQMPVETKMRRADFVIFNAGTLDCARDQLENIFAGIMNKMEKKNGRQAQHG